MDKRKPELIHIAIEMSDDSCAVMQFVTKEHPQMIDDKGNTSPGWTVDPTPENIERELNKTFKGAPVNWLRWQIIEPSEYVGRDRTFRSAWKLQGNKIDTDMAKARDVWRGVLREQRSPELAALDAAYMQADETNNQADKARIAAEKQKLRDITKDPRIDAAMTPEDLKLISIKDATGLVQVTLP